MNKGLTINSYILIVARLFISTIGKLAIVN